jgi:hypothetical protein
MGFVGLKKVLVFLLLLDSFSFLPYSVLWYSIIILLFNFFIISRLNFRFIIPLLVLNLIGIFGLRELNDAFFKDLWYYFKPILIFLAGTTVIYYYSSIEKFNNYIVYASIIQSFFNLITFFISKSELTELTYAHISVSSFVTVYGVIILIYNKFNSTLIRSIKWIILFICLTTILISFSRSIMLALAICFVVIRGPLRKRRFMLFTFSFSLALLFLYLTPELPILDPLFSKLKFSSKELELSNTFYNFDEFVSNWRGYESSLAILSFTKNLSIFSVVFGKGFGFLIDLQTYISLKEVFYRYIPKLHNGYLEVLCKTGILGLVLLITFYSRFLFYFRKYGKIPSCPKFSIRFPIAVVVILFVTTYTITGIYNKQALDSSLFILGFYFSFLASKYFVSPQAENVEAKPAPADE